MQEQLISFETAKLANEKGFKFQDWYEDYKYDFYCISEFVNDWRDSVNRYKVGDEIEGYYLNPLMSGKQDVVIYRSSQSFLQRWLREIHDIDISINILMNSSYILYIHQRKEVKFQKDIHPEYGENTYEQALEQGLIEGLKLI